MTRRSTLSGFRSPNGERIGVRGVLVGAFAAALVALVADVPAHAQQWTAPQEAPTVAPRNTGRRGTGGGTPADTRGTLVIDGALTIWNDDDEGPDSDSIVEFSTLVGFRYDIVPVFELEVQGGFALASPNEGDTEVNLSNILLSGFYVLRGQAWRLRLGGGLGLPTAQIGEDDLGFAGELINLFFAGAQRGFYDFAIWSPETFTLQLPSARFVYYASPQISIMAEAALSVFIDISDNFDRDTAVGLQMAGDFGYHPSAAVSFGARLNLVFIDHDSFLLGDDDEFQSSIEPHFRVNFGAGFFQARLTLNLDHPAGFAFDDGRIWAIHLGGGADF